VKYQERAVLTKPTTLTSEYNYVSDYKDNIYVTIMIAKKQVRRAQNYVLKSGHGHKWQNT